jgi:hypothetical protein
MRYLLALATALCFVAIAGAQEAAWRNKGTFKNVAPQPENWWKPGGLFPAFVQFSPDGKRLATGKLATLQSFALLDLSAGKDLTDRSISEDHRIEYQFLGFTPDGKAWGFREVASGPALVGFAVVDWVSGQERSRVTEKGRWRAALSPDGKVLAGINVDGKVILWDAATGKALGACPAAPTTTLDFWPFPQTARRWRPPASPANSSAFMSRIIRTTIVPTSHYGASPRARNLRAARSGAIRRLWECHLHPAAMNRPGRCG